MIDMLSFIVAIMAIALLLYTLCVAFRAASMSFYELYARQDVFPHRTPFRRELWAYFVDAYDLTVWDFDARIAKMRQRAKVND